MLDDSFKRLWTAYSVWGFRLDLDQLLRDGEPVAINEAWRRGDYNPLGGGALTAGLNMDVYAGHSENELHEAVSTFLTREARLLQAVRAQASNIDYAGLRTVVFVASAEEEPFGVELPPALMKLLADAGIPWGVGLSVFAGKPPGQQ